MYHPDEYRNIAYLRNLFAQNYWLVSPVEENVYVLERRKKYYAKTKETEKERHQ
jgi:hypothetical protein